jgi:hypothetical protein
MEHREKPTRVWLLPTHSKPRPLTEGELENFFSHSVDCGWEPRLKRLYELMGCELVQMLSFTNSVVPGVCWIDEDGRYKADAFINPTASVLMSSCLETTVVGACIYVVHETCLYGADEELVRAFDIASSLIQVPMKAPVLS